MINLKKNDALADAVKEILQQEALKGNQHLIDKNKNNKVDPEDFKILRGEKKVKKEEVEQIDELSINTLTRVKNAATSAASDASRESDEGKATKRYDLAGKASNKIETKNRALGLKPSGQHAMESVEEGLKDIAKKAFKALTGGSDEDQRKNLQKKMGVPQTGKKPVKEEVQGKTLKQFKEGWDEMMADVKKRGEPQPNGGSGKKQGSAYGGSKQKDKPEQDTEKK